jgi:hypothetical protein
MCLCDLVLVVSILLFSIFEFRIVHSVVFFTFYFALLEIKWNISLCISTYVKMSLKTSASISGMVTAPFSDIGPSHIL